MLKLQKNTEFLNSCHPVDLNQTLIYTARRLDRRLTEQFFAPRYINTWAPGMGLMRLMGPIGPIGINKSYQSYRSHKSYS